MAKRSKPKPAKKSWGDRKGNQWADTGACTFIDHSVKKKPTPAKLPEMLGSSILTAFKGVGKILQSVSSEERRRIIRAFYLLYACDDAILAANRRAKKGAKSNAN